MKKMIGCALANCVHTGGVQHFLELAEREGFETEFLGPAVSPERLAQAIKDKRPDYVCVGYRLTPENGVLAVRELDELLAKNERPILLFGGTGPVARAVARLGVFEHVFDGTEDIDDCIAFLRGKTTGTVQIHLADDLNERISQKAPYPLLRHHFGLPSYIETLEGIREIAQSGVLDVISLGPDQNTQQFFFRRDEADERMDGAGGVPIKTRKQFAALKEASQCGNYPMMRCYSGTSDVVKFAQLLNETINNAWCAVPLCWYDELDGRGTRTIEQSAFDARELMRRHAEWGIPVEMNEPHHWGLRDAHDVIPVAMSYIAALNAKSCGVKDYVSQYMFNTPNTLSFSMDLAKVSAQIELTESLEDESFRTYREVRTGLPFLSADLDVAKGQLAASTCLQMQVKPDIIHVVGFSEAERAASPQTVIESCKIVRGVVRSVMDGAADERSDERVQKRKAQLLSEAKYLIDYIRNEYKSVSAEPLCDPVVISDVIRRGILDAPLITRKEGFYGNLKTRVVDGQCVAWDGENKRELSERERLARLPQGTAGEVV